MTLIARGEHLQRIKSRGLLLRRPEGEFRIDVRAESSLTEADAASGDVVLLTTKGMDSFEALRAISTHGSELHVVCAQNGVENERTAARMIASVYGICVLMPARHSEPGVIVSFGQPKAGALDVGRFPSGADHIARSVAHDLSSCGFLSRPEPNIMAMKYAKLVRNTANAVQALTGFDRNDDSGSLVAEAKAEAYMVLRAAGIPVMREAELLGRKAGLVNTGEVPGEARGGNSTWQSLERGAGLESDFLNGEIVLVGKLIGIPTPVNAMLQRQLREMTISGDLPGSVSPSRLRALLDDG